ncbi:LysR family transcriptional regulator (plasmid) [Paraburkholderia sp. PREW-6R]|uniref:LysR family transcriptional regulator n=1 Tax=Paraburkholderia sp. PREW-6R TaxID=3141544 RepID=UPI0031F56C9E
MNHDRGLTPGRARKNGIDRLQAMQIFVKVVELNSFSRASEALGIPRATATTIIKNLESHLHVSLMHRTTRKLNVTAVGAHYYQLCRRILADIIESEDAMANLSNGPTGPLYVDMPPFVGRRLVAPRVAEFIGRYPKVELNIRLTDSASPFFAANVDCIICASCMANADYITRPLGDLQMVTAASPEYLRAHGVPRVLEDLQDHHVVSYYSGWSGTATLHNYRVERKRVELKLKRSVLLSDIEASVDSTVGGAGIIQAPNLLIESFLKSGRLVELFPQWKPASVPMAMQYTEDRHLVAKVRAFADWIAEIFREQEHIVESTLTVEQ